MVLLGHLAALLVVAYQQWKLYYGWRHGTPVSTESPPSPSTPPAASRLDPTKSRPHSPHLLPPPPAASAAHRTPATANASRRRYQPADTEPASPSAAHRQLRTHGIQRLKSANWSDATCCNIPCTRNAEYPRCAYLSLTRVPAALYVLQADSHAPPANRHRLIVRSSHAQHEHSSRCPDRMSAGRVAAHLVPSKAYRHKDGQLQRGPIKHHRFWNTLSKTSGRPAARKLSPYAQIRAMGTSFAFLFRRGDVFRQGPPRCLDGNQSKDL